jgi:hypothetical protein
MENPVPALPIKTPAGPLLTQPLDTGKEIALTGALWLAIVGTILIGMCSFAYPPRWESGAMQTVTVLAGVIGAILSGKFALSSPRATES